MSVPSSARVRKRRRALRKAGLRPIQLWVPDTRRRGFGAECRRQSQLASEADRRDGELMKFMDDAFDDFQDDAS